jgi:hypothetical protein
VKEEEEEGGWREGILFYLREMGKVGEKGKSQMLSVKSAYSNCFSLWTRGKRKKLWFGLRHELGRACVSLFTNQIEICLPPGDLGPALLVEEQKKGLDGD